MAYIPRLLRGPKRSKEDCNLWPNLGSAWLIKRSEWRIPEPECISIQGDWVFYTSSHSTIYYSYLFFTLHTQHSTLHALFPTLYIHSALGTPHSSLHCTHYAQYKPHLHPTTCTSTPHTYSLRTQKITASQPSKTKRAAVSAIGTECRTRLATCNKFTPGSPQVQRLPHKMTLYPVKIPLAFARDTGRRD